MLAEKETQQKEEPKKNEAGSASNTQNLVIIIVFVVVFAAAFMLLRGTRGNETESVFQGVRVLCAGCSGDAQATLHSVLAKPKVLIREELVNGNSSKNTVIAVAASQIARTFQKQNKTAYAFGVVDGKPEIECNAYTDNCSNETLVIAIGSCNCLRIDAQRSVARVEGTEEWFKENNYARVITIAGIIGGAVTQ